MLTGPLLGVLLHAIGGFAAGSFYAPLRKVDRWAWESFWLVMGIAAWLIAPWAVAWITTPDLIPVLQSAPLSVIAWCVCYGMFWGVGNLTFGLSVRYLGMALGYAAALGFCMLFGTLMPPIFEGQFGEILRSRSGAVILLGITFCLIGIGICGWAGMRKEAECSDLESEETVSEFSISKGFLLAAVAGILSACFAFGLSAGKPIAELSIEAGTEPLYSNNAVLVVILVGGLTSNLLWCLALNRRNGTFGDYAGKGGQPLFRNYALSSMAGLVWYGQFFFYGMGTTKLGEQYEFSSWSIHMAFIIVFSNLWGIVFDEWRGTSRKTKATVWVGLLTLIGSTIVIGYGNYLSD
ncbi:L-rhamnose/proton symporter RhaT [Rhodopirellula sallentina]|uniref:L-rhamnose/proton symporter RhaT n=1 Tax=Rhodopirellula sallentina TaxID=1263869 RepID=UPI000349EE2C|nr:L-rhamnose/proton symporter RhaT [Rhodopirellula sallentina]